MRIFQVKKILFASIVFLTLVACATYDDINFEAMNPLELAEYNRGRNIGQMIVCSENQRSFSRIRRRTCATVEQMYGSVAQAEQLNVLNTIQGYGSGGTDF